MHEKLVALSDEDCKVILNAFLTMYPPKDHSIEIYALNFYVNPNAEFPPEPTQVKNLSQIDFEYIQEQIEKCDDKLSSGDYDGAITNARTLLENICLYILEQTGED
jgi:hypothetical protein